MQFFRAYPSYRLKQVFRLRRKAPHLTSPSRRKQDPSIKSFISYRCEISIRPNSIKTYETIDMSE